MLGFFKSKNPDYDFDFHKDYTGKLLDKALDKFARADTYLCGGGFGNDSIKIASAQGAVGQAHLTLKEAIFHAGEAIKYGNGNKEKNMQIQAVVNNFASMSGKEMFVHPSVIEAWDNAIKQWTKEFSQLIPS